MNTPEDVSRNRDLLLASTELTKRTLLESIQWKEAATALSELGADADAISDLIEDICLCKFAADNGAEMKRRRKTEDEAYADHLQAAQKMLAFFSVDIGANDPNRDDYLQARKSSAWAISYMTAMRAFSDSIIQQQFALGANARPARPAFQGMIVSKIERLTGTTSRKLVADIVDALYGDDDHGVTDTAVAAAAYRQKKRFLGQKS